MKYIEWSGHISLKLRPHADCDGVVIDQILITDFSFSQDFPPALQEVEGPLMAETLLSLSRRESGRKFHFYITNILRNINLIWYIYQDDIMDSVIRLFCSGVFVSADLIN